MRINLPWGFIAIFVSLSLFYYFNQKNKIRKDERRARAKEKHQEYLQSLIDNRNDKSAQNIEDTNI